MTVLLWNTTTPVLLQESIAALTGASMFALLLAFILTPPVSLFLLWLYRRTILKGMDQEAKLVVEPPPIIQSVAGKKQPLRIKTQPANSIAFPATGIGLAAHLKRSKSQLRLTYLLAGLVFGLAFTIGWQMLVDQQITPLRTLLFIILFSWPVVLAFNQLFAIGWQERVFRIGLYFTLIIVYFLLIRLAGKGMDLLDISILWFILNGIPTVFLAATQIRKIRAVGPLVMGFFTVGITGTMILPSLFLGQDKGMVAGFESAFQINTIFGDWVTDFIGFIVLGLLGWALLIWLGIQYRLKRINDQSLSIDAIFLLFMIPNSLTLVYSGLYWILIGPLAYLGYKLVKQIGYRKFIPPARKDGKVPGLLLLRVFSLGKRSLRLYDALAKQWLHLGTISLIAGPDLVTGLVEPQEFLDFLAGKTSRQFVQDQTDLDARLQRFDHRSDPDGRYRTTEFFCRANTWKMTMKRLGLESDTVLMDLRSFSRTNQGCTFELEQLLNLVPLARILLIIDPTTDHDFLIETLQSLWKNIPPNSENGRLMEPELLIFEATSGTGHEAQTLMRLLLEQPKLKEWPTVEQLT
ncbi:MAG: hypothetical protein KDC80_03950 [Saprospiraceae bacterium]|nr:hypothetical protein [Saprospiraceae bacterium]